MLETILNNFHLEKILWILQKRIAYIMILGVLGGMAGGAYAYLTNSTLYRAEVSFYVYSDPDYVYDSSVNISNSEFTQAKNLVQSYILILKSNTILQKVLEEAGLDYGTEALSGRIGTSVVENTAVFYVYTYDSDPYRAMELANAIGRVAPREIGRIVKSGGIEVIDYATLPEAPYSSTSLVKYALVGFAGCFGASFVLFLLAGLMDTTIRRRYELKLAFRIPVLGDIPQIQAPDRKSKPVLVLGENSSFAVKESYNTIRANLLFTGKGERCPVYAVTSADKDEGKTLNSVNIAISYAQLGKKVLLIDGDMRNMSVASLLKLRGRLGLSQYLAGLRETPQIVEYRQNLDVLVGGAAAGIITCVWKARFPGEIILAMIPGIGLLIVSILTGGLLGEGDGLFLIVSGFFLEWQECVLLLITGQIFCGIFGLAMMVGAQIGTGGGSVRKQRLPFLPFLLPSALWLILIRVV